MIYKGQIKLNGKFQMECGEKKLAKNILKELLRLKASDIVEDQGVIVFKSPSSAVKNYLLYVISGKIKICNDSKVLRYSLNIMSVSPFLLVALLALSVYFFIAKVVGALFFFWVSTVLYFGTSTALILSFRNMLVKCVRKTEEEMNLDHANNDKANQQRGELGN